MIPIDVVHTEHSSRSVSKGREAHSALLVNHEALSSPYSTITEALIAQAERGAPFVTLHSGKNSVSLDARQALDRARRCTSALKEKGIARGDRVPILMPTSLEFIDALLGTTLMGASRTTGPAHDLWWRRALRPKLGTRNR
ncbi:MAG: AMP-binding protein [Myxococcales bacterium]|nr:MAG: AMP-binding protein [Myxococcales bacterium]